MWGDLLALVALILELRLGERTEIVGSDERRELEYEYYEWYQFCI